MKKQLKKLLMVGAILTLGATAFGAIEDLTSSGSGSSKGDYKWSGSADLKLKATGTVIDLTNKFGLLVRPTNSAGGGDILIDFGNVAVGETTSDVQTGFEAYIVSNDDQGHLLKYKINNEAGNNKDVVTSKFVTRNGYDQDTGLGGPILDQITEGGQNMTSLVQVSDGINTAHTIGQVVHQLTAGVDGNGTDYNGTVRSKLVVSTKANNGSFGADVGRVRVTVKDFKMASGDKGVALENREAGADTLPIFVGEEE